MHRICNILWLGMVWLLAMSMVCVAVPTHVLLLHSYHQGYNWTDEISDGVDRTLHEALGRVELHTEYLDSTHFPAKKAHHAELMAQLLDARYANQPLDCIITADDYALTFLLAHCSNLVARAPVVFCGVNDYSEQLLGAHRQRVTGLVEVLDVNDTLAVAVRLHPQADTVYVVSDGTPTGLGQRRSVRSASGLFPAMRFVYLNGEEMTTEAMIQRVEAAGDKGIILATTWSRDRNRNYIPWEATYPHLCAASQSPVYALGDVWMGQGIVGGKLSSGYAQGQQAARIATRLIRDGLQPLDIPVQTDSINTFVFDWRQLQHFGIDEAALPPGSEMLFRPYSVYRIYAPYLWAGAGLFVLLALFSAILLVNIVARRRAESNEQRLSTVVESTEEIIATGRPGRELSYLNAAGRRLFGIESLPVSWERVRESYAPDSLMLLEDVAMTSVQQNGHWQGELTMRRANGSDFPAVQTILAHRSPNGRLQYLSIVIRDISEQKRVERELIHRERDLRITLDSIGDAVIAADEEGHVTRVNQGATSLTGWPEEEAVGHDIVEVFRLVDSKTRDLVESPVTRVTREGRTVNLASNNLLISRDGTERQISDSAAPIRGRDGSSQGAVIVFRDVTGEHIMQERLQQAQKLEAVGLLAGGVAHDFNNLLTGILGNAELLRTQLAGDATGQHRCSGIIRAAERAADMTRQLLAFSRKGRYQNTPIDLHEMLRDVADLLSHTLTRDIAIDTRFESSMAVVTGDPAQLHSAFLNLAINARDAMLDGGSLLIRTRDVEIDEAAAEELPSHVVPGPFVEVMVRDTGIGISSDILSRIFEPFFTTKRQGEGTGLGLAGVHGCVEAHGGTISVVSAPGEGTTFTICLPQTEGEDPAEELIMEEPPAHGGLVLVIDDEEPVRDVLEASLSGLGYQVELCASGKDGIETFTRLHGKVTLVVLDLVMPVMGGRETFEELKKIDASVPVLIASGYTDNSRFSEMLEAGAAGTLGKPFKLDDLARTVSRCLAAHSAKA